MEIVTAGGKRHETIVEYHRGHWKNPMTDAELEAKFRKLAAAVLKPARTDRLLETLWRLEDLADAGEIVRLTNATSDE
jgi:2-methylcitrate dehydratase